MIVVFYTLFFLSALLLIAIILLQEPKGGGLAEAFGGHGAEIVGAGARGVNRVTLVLATVFVVSAILVHRFGG